MHYSSPVPQAPNKGLISSLDCLMIESNLMPRRNQNGIFLQSMNLLLKTRRKVKCTNILDQISEHSKRIPNVFLFVFVLGLLSWKRICNESDVLDFNILLSTFILW